jgi:protein-tyrosine-phosphatase
LTGHISHKITPAVVKKAAVIIALDKKVYSTAKNSLQKQFPKEKYKIHLFSELTKKHKDIKDPSGSGSARVHKSIIHTIYFTIKKRQNSILDWTNHAKQFPKT